MKHKPRHLPRPDLPPDVAELFEAVQHGHVNAMVRVLDAGISPNSEDERGSRPLHIVAFRNYYELIEYLVVAGADLEAHHPGRFFNINGCSFAQLHGFTALHCTLEWSYVEAARELLRCGADINARNAVGETPLRMAVETSGTYRIVQPEMARLFIEAGADVNTRDNWGETILREAIRSAHLAPHDEPSREIIRLLIERGALLG